MADGDPMQKHSHRNSPRGLVIVMALAAWSTACSLGGPDTSVAPAQITTPPIAFDLDAQRAQLEAHICADPASGECAVLRVLDASDGTTTDPPSLPETMPLVIESHGISIDVPAWIESERNAHDFVPAISVPLDLGDATAAKSALKGAVIGDATFLFGDDTLALDLPELDIAVSRNGKSTLVGVIAKHTGESGDPAPLSLAEGGSQALLDAVTAGDASLSIAIPKSAPLGLKLGPNDTIVRPGGAAQLSLHVVLDIAQDTAVNLASSASSAAAH